MRDCVPIKSEFECERDRPTGCYARAFPARSFASLVLDFREPRETNRWESQSETSTSAIKHDRVDRDVWISNEDFWMELSLYLSLTMIDDT